MPGHPKIRYAKNALANLLGNFALAGLMVVATPLIIDRLGGARYGLLRVALVSLVGYSSLLDLGLNNAVRRFFGDAFHRRDWVAANRVLGLGYRLYFFLSACSLGFMASTLWWLPPLVKVPQEELGAFRWLLAAAGVFGAGQFMLCPLQSVLIAGGRYELLQVSQVMVRLILFAGGTILLYLWSNSLTTMALSAVTATLLTLWATQHMARRVFPDMGIEWRYRDRGLLRKILAFGGQGILIALGPMAVYHSQDLLVSAFLGPEQVTAYGVAAILMTQMRAVGNAIASPLFPIAIALQAQKKQEAIGRLLVDGTLRCLWIWGALAAPLFVLADRLLATWIAPQYAGSCALVWVLLLGNWGTTMNYSSTHILTAAGSIKWLGYLQLMLTVVSVAATITVLAATPWGLIGVAAAVSLPTAMRSGILVPIYACLQVGVKPGYFFLRTMGPLTAYLGAGMLLAWILRVCVMRESLLSVLLAFGVSSGLMLLAGFWMILPSQQRAGILTAVVSWRKGRGGSA